MMFQFKILTHSLAEVSVMSEHMLEQVMAEEYLLLGYDAV
jgi:hypothetical protein